MIPDLAKQRGIVILIFFLWLSIFLTSSGLDCKTSPRRRAYSTNQITDYNPAKKVYTPSDPNSVVAKNPLRRTKVQELIGQMSPEHEAQWRNDYQVWPRMVMHFKTTPDYPLLFSIITSTSILHGDKKGKRIQIAATIQLSCFHTKRIIFALRRC